jgi:RHS repeat-associated protein
VYNLRFPGQYYDAETGLNQNVNRDYDPLTGKYLESDPIGLAAGVNTYAYVGGDPVSNRDPSGLLVRGDGWSDGEWRNIQSAEAKIRKELAKGCSCPSGNCIPCNLLPALLNKIDTAIVAYAPLGGDCGWTPPSSGLEGFFVSRVPWGKVPHKTCKPGCLASTIYHELLHTTGVIFDYSTPTEPPASVLERECIGQFCKEGRPR